MITAAGRAPDSDFRGRLGPRLWAGNHGKALVVQGLLPLGDYGERLGSAGPARTESDSPIRRRRVRVGVTVRCPTGPHHEALAGTGPGCSARPSPLSVMTNMHVTEARTPDRTRIWALQVIRVE
jgi:hypothetical protein